MGALGIDTVNRCENPNLERFHRYGCENHDWETRSSLALQPCTMYRRNSAVGAGSTAFVRIATVSSVIDLACFRAHACTCHHDKDAHGAALVDTGAADASVQGDPDRALPFAS